MSESLVRAAEDVVEELAQRGINNADDQIKVLAEAILIIAGFDLVLIDTAIQILEDGDEPE